MRTMRKPNLLDLLATVALALAAAVPLAAQSGSLTTYPLVGARYTYGTVAGTPVYGTSLNIGSSRYTTLDVGSRTYTGVTQSIGDLSLSSWSDGYTSSTQQIGRTSFTTDSEGTSYTSQQIGRMIFTNGSDGSNAVTQRIGSFDFTTITLPSTYRRRPPR